ncbi:MULTISPECIES: hypothetical protein [unclassified Nostoc]|nr:hypothetical protein [Nostoc sp. DedQUE03]MDZ7973017.1 hypothetical protein [Nostoc sp. DedQUE03]MDZ8044463.1 hypothetical protein [Nostoc sp. DedQUE02]
MTDLAIARHLRTELYATIYPITSSVEQTIEVTNNLLKLERVES